MAEFRKQAYPKRIEQLLAMRRDIQAKARADDAWQGWQWKPSDAELAGYTGTYGNDDPHNLAQVRWDGEALQINQGEHRVMLEPAAHGLFGATESPLDAPEPVRFARNASGELSLDWGGDHLTRQRRTD
jgi:hypothetical protein